MKNYVPYVEHNVSYVERHVPYVERMFHMCGFVLVYDGSYMKKGCIIYET